MKRIFIFIGLKMLEVGGLIGLLYLLSFYHKWLIPLVAEDNASLRAELNMHWIASGILGLILLIIPLGALFAVGVLLYLWISSNLGLSEKWSRK